MDKDKRLMEASWWKGLAVGKSGSCSVGKAMLSKSLIQFSAEGWGLRPNYGRGNGSNGDLLHKDLRQHAEKQRHYFANKGPSSQGYGFSSSHACMWELGYKESWAPKNWCFWTVVLEKTLESPLDCKEIQPVHQHILGVHWKDWCWSWNSNTLTTWCEELTHWKRPWCQERLRAGEEGDDRGWDGWMASLTQWTWIWTGRPGVLQLMGSQRVRHDWVTELYW